MSSFLSHNLTLVEKYFEQNLLTQTKKKGGGGGFKELAIAHYVHSLGEGSSSALVLRYVLEETGHVTR